MGYHIQGCAILALTFLAPVVSSQEVLSRAEPRIEPRPGPDFSRDPATRELVRRRVHREKRLNRKQYRSAKAVI